MPFPSNNDPARRIERMRNNLLKLDDEDLRDMIEFASEALNLRTGQLTLFEPQVDVPVKGDTPAPHKQKGLAHAGAAFERFWETLPSQMKQQKRRAERYWQRNWLTWGGPGAMEDTLTKALAFQVRHQHFKGSDDKFYYPFGSTWLNDARWNDDVTRLTIAERAGPELDIWQGAYPIYSAAVIATARANGHTLPRGQVASLAATNMPNGPYPLDWVPTDKQIAVSIRAIEAKEGISGDKT